MTTINISLPKKLKKQAQDLVDGGVYASFSDLVRDALRRTVEKNRYDLMYEEALEDKRQGRGVTLMEEKDVDDYFDSLK